MATTTTNQMFDAKSALWEELTDAQAQSASGGLSTVLPITYSSITALPLSQGSPVGTAPQTLPFAIPFPGR